jgi:threonylcarbamoyladenosine tRNA methylthiotransferase MtaB
VRRFKVAIATVGCRSNQADSTEIARHLDGRLIEIALGFDEVDLAVINTCCVTAEAERDCRKLARRALGASPYARVILWGCAVSAIVDFGKDIDDRVERIGGIENPPSKLAARINELARAAGVEIPPAPFDVGEGFMPSRMLGRTRALLKIQNGCSRFCAYCVVPLARGPERSVPADIVLENASRLRAQGCNEVVLTGVQLGAWGADLTGTPRLADLILKVADSLETGRLRLSSIEPWSVGDELIEAVAGHERICPHFHLPMQSGDDRVLMAMKRGYNSSEYIELINRIRRRIPDVSIGADVLLGFSGEDERAFENTMLVLEEIRPAYLHAFTYSPRPGTKAANLAGRPKRNVAKDRTIVVRKFGEKSACEYRSGQVGKIREVIVEERRKGFVAGLTDNFIPVRFDSNLPAPGELVMARLESAKAGENRLRAVILQSDR